MTAGTRWPSAIMYTDIVGYTPLSERDEEVALRLLEEHRTLLRSTLQRFRGREIKTMGDGFLVEFDSSLSATQCAVEIQRLHSERNARRPDEPIELRIGIHAGEVVHQDSDVFGSTVNVASRIRPLARAGGICISRSVADQIRGRFEWPCTEMGPTPLKGVEAPPTLFRVELPWPTRAPAPETEKSPRPGLPGPAGREVPLVDRQEELVALRGFVEATASGEGGLLLLSGEAGIGKTRLVREVRKSADLLGVRTILGSSLDIDGGVPYAPWREVVRRVVRDEAPENLGRYCGIYGNELAKLVPELAHKIAAPSELPSAPSPEERLRFFDGITQFFERLTEDEPILIVLEGLMEADTASLQLLRHLVRNLKGARWSVLGTCREFDVTQPGPLSDCITGLNRDRLLRTLPLARLGLADVARVVEGVLGDPATVAPSSVDRIYRKTGGNPFFVEELTQALVEAGDLRKGESGWEIEPETEVVLPPTVRKVVLGRLSRLDPRTIELLRLAAVLGEEFDIELLRRLSGATPDSLVDLLDPALRAGLLREGRRLSRQTLGGFHDRPVRETLYDELSHARRRLYHERAGVAIEELYRGNLDEHSAELARHFTLANDSPRVVEHSLRAAEFALKLYAYEDAARYLRAALEHLGPHPERRRRARVLERLGEVSAHMGRFALAIDYFRESARAYRESGETSRAAEVLRRALTCAEQLSSDTRTYFEVFEEARSLLKESPAGPELARLLGSAAIGFLWSGRRLEGRRMAERAVHLAKKFRLADVEMSASYALSCSMPISKTRSALLRLRRWERFERSEVAPLPVDIVAEQYVGVAFGLVSGRGDWKAAISLLERANDKARRARLFERVAYLRGILNQFYFESGQGDAGRRACDEVTALVQRFGLSEPFYLDVLSNRGFYDGDLEEARARLLESWGPVVQIAPRHRALIGFHEFAGLICAEMDRLKEAQGHLEKAVALAQFHGLPMDQVHWLVPAYSTLVEVLVRSGQYRAADRQLKALRRVATAVNHDIAWGHAWRAAGHWAAAHGRPLVSVRSFERAVHSWQRVGWDYWTEIARWDLGLSLCAAGEREKGERTLDLARAHFGRMGLPRWADLLSARRATAAAAPRRSPARSRRTGPAPSTPSRRRGSRRPR